jgi:hypothetical protein
MPLSEPLTVTLALTSIFDKIGISYLVGGSLASSLHGIPRATQDVDIVADIRANQISVLVKEMTGAWYIDEKQAREALLHFSSFNTIHLESMYKVDVFILKKDPLSSKEMDRRIKFQVSGDSEKSLYIATAEDIILQKLLWYEKGGKVSERQWKDASGVANIQKGLLDIPYMQNMALTIGVKDLLKSLFSEAGIGTT